MLENEFLGGRWPPAAQEEECVGAACAQRGDDNGTVGIFYFFFCKIIFILYILVEWIKIF